MRTRVVGVTIGLGLALGLVFARAAGAVEVDGIYEAQVPVDTQSTQERSTAIRTALGQVLVKVSGSSEATSISGINDILDNATHYVQQYRYRTVASDNAGAGSSGSKALALWVRFDPDAIDRLLRGHGQTVWGRARPVALLWLAIQQHGQRELLSADSQRPAHRIVLSEANRRGLPLRLPLLDLQDQSAISPTDVWGDFQDTIMQASKRYQTEGVLVGRAYQSSDGQWHARWTLYQGQSHQSWQSKGGALAEALDPGIDHSADILSRRFAQASGGDTQRSILLKVDDIKNLAQYARTADYLSSLSPVSAVQPSVLRAGSAVFRLTIRGDRMGVVQAISLGHMLVAEQPPAQSGAQSGGQDTVVQASAGPVPELVYRLVP